LTTEIFFSSNQLGVVTNAQLQVEWLDTKAPAIIFMIAGAFVSINRMGALLIHH